MRIHLKLTNRLRDAILRDLGRPHPFAYERVGFISCRPATTSSDLLIIAAAYHPVADEDYLPDDTVGAMMGPNAIRKALQYAYNNQVSMVHVHVHSHRGHPRFSSTDLRETANFVPDFFNVRPDLPHGALVLSADSAVFRCWTLRSSKPQWAAKVSFVGYPQILVRNDNEHSL
jgi:proteasome lid subunit RPN8/RPN11